MGHTSDWFPGRVSKDYRDHYDNTFSTDVEIPLPCENCVLNRNCNYVIADCDIFNEVCCPGEACDISQCWDYE